MVLNSYSNKKNNKCTSCQCISMIKSYCLTTEHYPSLLYKLQVLYGRDRVINLQPGGQQNSV